MHIASNAVENAVGKLILQINVNIDKSKDTVKVGVMSIPFHSSLLDNAPNYIVVCNVHYPKEQALCLLIPTYLYIAAHLN